MYSSVGMRPSTSPRSGMPHLRAEAHLLRPIDDRVGAHLDAGLIEPRVARFRERLDEIQEAAVDLLPVVEVDVADLNRGRALKPSLGPTAPLSSAAMPTGTLKTEPGG